MPTKSSVDMYKDLAMMSFINNGEYAARLMSQLRSNESSETSRQTLKLRATQNFKKFRN